MKVLPMDWAMLAREGVDLDGVLGPACAGDGKEVERGVETKLGD